jgi:hypothetical protein
VKPRADTILPLRMQLPANAPPGDDVGGVVVSLTGKATGTFGQGQGSNEKVNLEQRLALLAEFRVAGPLHPNLSIEHFTSSYSGPIDPFSTGTATLHYEIHNGGNVVMGGPQTVTVHGLFGESVSAPQVVEVPSLLPGATYPITVRVPKVYPEMLMHSKVTINEQGLAGEVTPGLHPISSSKWFIALPLVVTLAVLVVILLVAYRIWRRRRRRRPSDQQQHPVGKLGGPSIEQGATAS